MPNNFEEASAATQDLFENGQVSLDDIPPAEEEMPPAENEAITDEVPDVQPDNKDANSVLNEAAETAEVAAQLAAEKDNQLQQAMQAIDALKQQNAQLQGQNQQMQGTIDELSRQNEQSIVGEALTPPTLDINGLAFADEDTQKAAMAKFAEDMSAYNREQMMKELSPALEYAKQGLREKEKNEIVDALSLVPELTGFKDMLPQLDRIIANNKWLQSDNMPLDERYLNAYAMAMGVNSMNAPPPEPAKEPTTDELMELYNNNPAFQEMVEKQRLEKIKQSQQVPSHAASSGAVNAALNIKEKPKTLEEASKRTFEDFNSMFN